MNEFIRVNKISYFIVAAAMVFTLFTAIGAYADTPQAAAEKTNVEKQEVQNNQETAQACALTIEKAKVENQKLKNENLEIKQTNARYLFRNLEWSNGFFF